MKNRGAEEDLKISSYYKKDYVSMNVWATAIWFTIGYGIVAALIAFCLMEQILKNLNDLKACDPDRDGYWDLLDTVDHLLLLCETVL